MSLKEFNQKAVQLMISVVCITVIFVSAVVAITALFFSIIGECVI